MSAEVSVQAGGSRFHGPPSAVGLRGDFAAPPVVYPVQHRGLLPGVFEFKGALVDTRVAVEYNPWDHFGFGLGFDNFV